MNRTQCTLCPRNCKVDRTKDAGFCGASFLPTVAKVMLHQWEEPCICYDKGSGAVFFSGCQLRCVFCQNHEISSKLSGKELDCDSLSDLFLMLEQKGACNVNLVSATPYLQTVIPALEKAKLKGLSIPIVFNSGGYESVDSIKTLQGLVDVYLPDFKFYSSELSSSYAKASDYQERALECILEMVNQTGAPTFSENHLLRGVIIRHLVLPGSSDDSVKILELLSKELSSDSVILSLMRQYTPMFRAKEFPKLNRRITTLEYNRVVKAAEKFGFKSVYTQKAESVGVEYVPDFSTFFHESN